MFYTGKFVLAIESISTTYPEQTF